MAVPCAYTRAVKAHNHDSQGDLFGSISGASSVIDSSCCQPAQLSTISSALQLLTETESVSEISITKTSRAMDNVQHSIGTGTVLP
jgi:hypothetical protein